MAFKFHVSKKENFSRWVEATKNGVGPVEIVVTPQPFPHERLGEKLVISVKNTPTPLSQFTTIELKYNPQMPQSVNVTIGEH